MIGLVTFKEKEERSLSLHIHSEERPCEHTARRWLFIRQEERPHQKPTLAP